MTQVHSTEYIAECLRLFSDRKFYILENSDLTQEHNVKFHKLVNEIYGNSSLSENYEDKEPKDTVFYTLHKKNVNLPSGRPILSEN